MFCNSIQYPNPKDWSSWSLKSVCNRQLQNAYDKKFILKVVEYNDPHKYHSRLLGFPFTSQTNMASHLWSHIFDSDKLPTVLVRKVKGKPGNFEANVCGSQYSTFKTSIYPYAFYNKGLQTLFKDQLDRSTCSFNQRNFNPLTGKYTV